jgi:hypothetical protein
VFGKRLGFGGLGWIVGGVLVFSEELEPLEMVVVYVVDVDMLDFRYHFLV